MRFTSALQNAQVSPLNCRRAKGLLGLALVAILLAPSNGIELNPFRQSNSGNGNGNNNDGGQKKQANHGNGNGSGSIINELSLSDAATGTITTLEPGKEKEPVSCNEIMAKAVVVASEEKEVFRQQAVAANDLAAKEKYRADGLAAQIDAALQEARNATIEFEALKLMSERLLTEAKNEAAQKLQTVQDELQAQIGALRTEMERVESEAAQSVKNAESRAAQEVKEAQGQAKDREEKANSDAKYQLERAQQASKDLVEKIKQEAKVAVDAAMAKAQEIERKARAEAEEKIKQIQKETNERADRIVSEAELARDEAFDRAVEIEVKADASVRNAMHAAESAILEAQRAAEAQSEQMRFESTQMVEKLKTEMTEKLSFCEAKLENHTMDYQEELEGMEETISLQIKTIAEKDADLVEMKTNMEALSRDYEYWKTDAGRNLDELLSLRLKEDFSSLVLLLVCFWAAIATRMYRWVLPLGLWLVFLPFRLLFFPFRFVRSVIL